MTRKLTVRIEDLYTIDALTGGQRDFFKWYGVYPVISLIGCPGTGKSFLALYKALESVMDKGNNYNKVIIVRSPITTGKDIGAIPGDVSDKSTPFQNIYMSMCDSLFSSGAGSYNRLKAQGKLEFCFTSHLRGTTLDNSIVIVDEIQNMTYQEVSTVITRLGEDSRIIFCGDERQNDIQNKTGIKKFQKVLEGMPSHFGINFGIEDIVRSGVVKEFLISEVSYETKAGD